MAVRRKKTVTREDIKVLSAKLLALSEHLDLCVNRLNDAMLPSIECEISTAQNQGVDLLATAVSRIDAEITKQLFNLKFVKPYEEERDEEEGRGKSRK